MGALEKYKAVADKLNTYGIAMSDVWLEHIKVRCFVDELESGISRGPLSFLYAESPPPIRYGIACSLTGSLYAFGCIRLRGDANDDGWNHPEIVRDMLERGFNEKYHTYYDEYYNGTDGCKHYVPPLAAKVKLDYEHHLATMDREKRRNAGASLNVNEI